MLVGPVLLFSALYITASTYYIQVMSLYSVLTYTHVHKTGRVLITELTQPCIIIFVLRITYI